MHRYGEQATGYDWREEGKKEGKYRGRKSRGANYFI